MYYFSIITDNTFLVWMRKIWERHTVFKFKGVVEKFGRGCSWNFISSSNIDENNIYHERKRSYWKIYYT